MSFRNEFGAHAITLTIPMLPTSCVMVFDTRVSSEQTVKQQEHALQGVAQMVMNMETEYVLPPATLMCFRRMFCVCWKLFRQTTRCLDQVWRRYGPVKQLTDKILPRKVSTLMLIMRSMKNYIILYVLFCGTSLNSKWCDVSWKRTSKALQLVFPSLSNAMHSLCINLPLHEWTCSVRSYYNHQQGTDT